MLEFLQKIFSKEFQDRLAAFILSQFDLNLPNAEKKQRAVDFGVSLLEQIDDTVALVPGWGWLLKLLVDNGAVDAAQRQLVDGLVEVIYRGIKIAKSQ
jgi:hypothetical protein